jgi:hypothetical protein
MPTRLSLLPRKSTLKKYNDLPTTLLYYTYTPIRDLSRLCILWGGETENTAKREEVPGNSVTDQKYQFFSEYYDDF